jgi:carbamoyl-phosphate synthase large subunit
MLKNGDFSLVINTTEGEEAIADSYAMRRAALDRRVTYTTTIAGARATVTGIAALDARDVNRLQDLHQETVHA